MDEESRVEEAATSAAPAAYGSLGIVQIDSSGRIHAANALATDLLGCSAQELTALSAADFIHAEDMARLREEMQERGSGGQPWETQLRISFPDQSIVPLTAAVAPISGVAGGPEFAIIASADAARRQRAEEALKESEERFRFAVEQAPLPIVMISKSGEVLQTSKVWDEQTGFSAGDLPHIRIWIDFALGADAPRLWTQFERLFDTPAHLNTEVEVRSRNGETHFWALTASAPGLLRDGHRFVIALALNITDRRRAEEALRESQERLQMILEAAREYAIFTLDLDLRVTSWNPGAQRILGYSEEEILGRDGAIIFSPEDIAIGQPGKEKSDALNLGRAVDERWHIRKDGDRFWSNGFMMPMHDGAGSVTGFVKILRDATDERRAQDELEQSRADLWEALQENEHVRDELEAASKAKDDFLAVLSHELRTPLTPILMGIHLLSRTSECTEQAQETLEMIRRNVEIEAHFIDDLLDITRIGRGKLEILRDEVDAHAIVQHAVEVAQNDFDSKHQHLTVQLNAQDARLSGDRHRLQQVFWNLLKNASKFTPDGGSISISTRNADDWLCVTVTDTGEGISPEAFPRIFDAFSQESREITRRFGGLGLGLAIARATIEAHRGRIRAESGGRGRGSTFIVELPLLSNEVEAPILDD